MQYRCVVQEGISGAGRLAEGQELAQGSLRQHLAIHRTISPIILERLSANPIERTIVDPIGRILLSQTQLR